MKIFFAHTGGITKESVEPFHNACVARGIPCDLANRGGYGNLAEQLAGYTHYVFGVGPDISWITARNAGLKTINIQHGQYVFGTWMGASHADEVMCMGSAYVEDGERYLAKPVRLHASGYIRAGKLLSYRKDAAKDLDLLVILPHIGEHKHLNVVEPLVNLLKDCGLRYGVKVHPRNNGTKHDLTSRGITVVEGDFYDLASRSRACLSSPSNCIIECAAWGLPCAFLGEAHNNNNVSRIYLTKCRNSYASICHFTEVVGDLKGWLTSPKVEGGDVGRYISNLDGNTEKLIQDFLNLL